jgi:hypothetical protein
MQASAWRGSSRCASWSLRVRAVGGVDTGAVSVRVARTALRAARPGDACGRLRVELIEQREPLSKIGRITTEQRERLLVAAADCTPGLRRSMQIAFELELAWRREGFRDLRPGGAGTSEPAHQLPDAPSLGACHGKLEGVGGDAPHLRIVTAQKGCLAAGHRKR